MHGVLALLVGSLTLLASLVVASQAVGKRTRMTACGAAARDIRRECLTCFTSPRWTPVNGPGLVNMALSGRWTRARSVVSVAIEERASGGYLVSVWRSQGPAWVELDDALMISRIQTRILGAVSAMPHAVGSRPSVH